MGYVELEAVVGRDVILLERDNDSDWDDICQTHGPVERVIRDGDQTVLIAKFKSFRDDHFQPWRVIAEDSNSGVELCRLTDPITITRHGQRLHIQSPSSRFPITVLEQGETLPKSS